MFTTTSELSNNNYRLGSFLWLKKQASCWSLRSNASKLPNSPSTASLPISLTSESSSSTNTISQSNLPCKQEPPPPAYEDPLHPWSFKFPKSLTHRKIEPREEEGKETLPEYDCTIDKMAYLRIKCEFVTPEVRSTSRSWREYYVYVYGTKIMAYNHNPKNKKKEIVPIWSYTMQNAQVSVATDYMKHKNAFRLKLSNGPQFLMTVPNESEKFNWIDAMESSISISADLDVRPMPEITNHRRRRRRNANGSNRS